MEGGGLFMVAVITQHTKCTPFKEVWGHAPQKFFENYSCRYYEIESGGTCKSIVQRMYIKSYHYIIATSFETLIT